MLEAGIGMICPCSRFEETGVATGRVEHVHAVSVEDHAGVPEAVDAFAAPDGLHGGPGAAAVLADPADEVDRAGEIVQTGPAVEDGEQPLR